MLTAKVRQVIITDLALRGQGTEGSPMRRVYQIWSLDGMLLAEVDPCELAPGDVHIVPSREVLAGACRAFMEQP